MYRDNELDNITIRRGDKVADARKNIPCIVYGLTNKKRNTKQEASLFRSKEEALAFSPLVTKLEMGCDDKTQDIMKSLTDLELDLDKFLEF